MSRPAKTVKSAAPAGSVRIIAGRWRGSRLPVADSPGLRPSSDRMRETLFNWLQPWLPGARVLDLFAGTGALGFEALSRGAAQAVLLERDHTLAASLATTQQKLAAADAVVVCADSLQWLRAQQGGVLFDGAFVDPPFAAGLWQAAVEAVLPHLAARAWLYVESGRDTPPPLLPPGWRLHRQLASRDALGSLYHRQ